ncbi:hypothetical protein C0991_007905 [Blastosporella zonata]|nr:hypothetical protein C0991_007905 [Blastosporella zonata]
MLYTNSFLATLNARQAISKKAITDDTDNMLVSIPTTLLGSQATRDKNTGRRGFAINVRTTQELSRIQENSPEVQGVVDDSSLGKTAAEVDCPFLVLYNLHDDDDLLEQEHRFKLERISMHSGESEGADVLGSHQVKS